MKNPSFSRPGNYKLLYFTFLYLVLQLNVSFAWPMIGRVNKIQQSRRPPIAQMIMKIWAQPPRSAYVHIPFCRRRCHYCNFPISVVGDRPSTQIKVSHDYTDVLVREINAVRKLSSSSSHDDLLHASSSSSSPLETIYFGGGTPSLLPPECITRIIDTLSSSFGGLAHDAEVTLEMDPGTFDLVTAQKIKQCGVNRISLGVQSFDDVILSGCGRAHSSRDVVNALQLLKSVGFDNISLDLISSLPHLTLDLWEKTLKRAISLDICTHISVYDLQVEEKTAFGRWYTPGSFPLPSNEESAQMYKMAVQILTAAGFEHYEVSNYAKQGRRSRHNQQYWKCNPVWGFGLGAASFVGGVRYTRPSSMSEYVKFVEQLELYSDNDNNKDNNNDNYNDSGNISNSDSDSKTLVAMVNKCENTTTSHSSHDIDNPFIQSIMRRRRNNYTSTTTTSTHNNNINNNCNNDNNNNNDSDNISHDVPGYGGADSLEVVMLSLRTSDGLDIPSFQKTFGRETVASVIDALQPFQRQGMVEFKYINITHEVSEGYDKQQKSGCHISSLPPTELLQPPPNHNRQDLFDNLASVRLTESGFIVSNDIISSVFARIS